MLLLAIAFLLAFPPQFVESDVFNNLYYGPFLSTAKDPEEFYVLNVVDRSSRDLVVFENALGALRKLVGPHPQGWRDRWWVCHVP